MTDKQPDFIVKVKASGPYEADGENRYNQVNIGAAWVSTRGAITLSSDFDFSVPIKNIVLVPRRDPCA